MRTNKLIWTKLVNPHSAGEGLDTGGSQSLTGNPAVFPEIEMQLHRKRKWFVMAGNMNMTEDNRGFIIVCPAMEDGPKRKSDFRHFSSNFHEIL